MFFTNPDNTIVGSHTPETIKLSSKKHGTVTLQQMNIIKDLRSQSNIFDKDFSPEYAMNNRSGSDDYSLDIKSITNSNPVANYMSGDYNTHGRSSGYVFLKFQVKSDGLFNATIDIDGITGSLIFDLNESDTIDALSENLNVMDLFPLDDNRDGLLDENDEYFDKLKVVITRTHLKNSWYGYC